MAIFESLFAYIENETTLRARITAIDAAILVLETSVLKAVGNGDISEYSINDGQTVIRTVYRNAKEVIESIQSLEAVRQMYINRLYGRSVRLVDSKSFKR